MALLNISLPPAYKRRGSLLVSFDLYSRPSLSTVLESAALSICGCHPHPWGGLTWTIWIWPELCSGRVQKAFWGLQRPDAAMSHLRVPPEVVQKWLLIFSKKPSLNERQGLCAVACSLRKSSGPDWSIAPIRFGEWGDQKQWIRTVDPRNRAPADEGLEILWDPGWWTGLDLMKFCENWMLPSWWYPAKPGREVVQRCHEQGIVWESLYRY